MSKINDWNWHEFASIGSTNDEVKKLTTWTGQKFLVSSHEQTDGRGRRGRNWVSIPGNLFVSFALEVSMEKLGQMIFVIGLSLAETIHRLAPELDVKIKWPNDVLVNGGKISGILLEKGEGDYLVIGVGVNLVGAPENVNLLYPAVSLHQFGIEIDRLAFLEKLTGVFDEFLAAWQKHGFTLIKNLWLKQARGLGERIRVVTEQGTIEGIFNGVDENGLLLLEQKGNLQKIYAGDVFYI